MLHGFAEWFAGSSLPDLSGPILGCGEHPLPVRAEYGAVEPPSVIDRLAERCPGRGLPNVSGPILRCGDDPLPVRAEYGGKDVPSVLHRFAERLAGGGVPQLRGPAKCGEHPLPIRTEYGDTVPAGKLLNDDRQGMLADKVDRIKEAGADCLPSRTDCAR